MSLIDLETKVLAHRYLYYVLAMPIITDFQYDALESEARAQLPPSSAVHKCGSDLASSYTETVKEEAKTLLEQHYGKRI